MTLQKGERLFYNGEEIWMEGEPLEQYLQTRNDIIIIGTSSNCWRGYYGSWEIKDNRLYLIKFEACLFEEEIDLSYLFPGEKKVFANWFNGVLRIPLGDLMSYGAFSVFEKELLLTFKEGVLIDEKQISNKRSSFGSIR